MGPTSISAEAARLGGLPPRPRVSLRGADLVAALRRRHRVEGALLGEARVERGEPPGGEGGQYSGGAAPQPAHGWTSASAPASAAARVASMGRAVTRARRSTGIRSTASSNATRAPSIVLTPCNDS